MVPVANFRTRRAKRGVVFVEAVVVSILLMLLLAGGLFFHRLYAKKMETIRSARSTVWVEALEGCGYNMTAAEAFQHVTGGAPSSEALPDGVSQDVNRMIGKLPMRSASAAGSVTADQRVGGGSYATSTRTQVACADLPQKKRGDPYDVFKFAAPMLLPLFN